MMQDGHKRKGLMAGRQSQPRWSVAHVHLNYISSAVKRCGKTTALPAEERGEDSHREIERERVV
jgi:hypothetical protein